MGAGTGVRQTEPAESPALPIDLTQVPVADRDRVWLEKYYQGDDAPQATVRAILVGGVIGGVMSLSNLYIGLKTGWGLGVGITACILSYAVWNLVVKLGLSKNQLSILENNCMQSTATSAGVSTGGTMVSAIAAFLIINKVQMPFWVLFFWTMFLALLGVSIAVPMKRQMINREQLKFPSGTAAAETLRSLYAEGGVALKKAQSLFLSLGIGAVIKWFVEGNAALWTKVGQPALAKIAIPATWELPFHVNGKEAGKFGLGLPIDPLMMAAGAIVGLRTAWSMTFGAIVLYGVLGPWLDEHRVFAEMVQLGALKSEAVSSGNIRKWGLWTGSAMMVTAGLTAFAFQWKSLLNAFKSLGSVFRKDVDAAHDPVAHIEVPTSWFVLGTGVSGIGCIVIMRAEWGVPVALGLVAVLFAFVLSLVACRATGETDITPIGAMGKVTQLFYGVAMPQNATANLMTAGVTAGAAGAAADLLTDLKSGYLLGANARKQTLAQAAGILFGTIVIVPAWYILVPNADVISGETARFAAPAATVWASVAELLSKGLSSLHPTILTGMIAGGVLGVLLPILDRRLPTKIVRYLPSATGLGLAFVIEFHDSVAFLIGALVAWGYAKRDPQGAETYVVPVSSGIIAGESLMGVLIAFLGAFGLISTE